MPIISIITVSYNNENTIEATIKSVIELNSIKADFIVIDGGSTDGTVNILKKYEGYLTYLVSEPDNGIYDAMNKGWLQAKNNSYVLFLGAGDLLVDMPDIESFNKADIIAGSVQIGSKFLFKPKTDIRLRLGNTLHHQALFIKKDLHIAPPFNLLYGTYADFDFNQRLIKAGHKIYIDSHFKGYALEGGLSTKFDKKQSLAIVRKNFGWFYMMLAIIYYTLRHEI
jgi:glycosyltransferase involved in cell wall biosynthesis